MESLIVIEETAKQRILTALSDSYSRQILTATSTQSVSALELSHMYEIPITTVYRRIQELVDAGLIAAVKSGRTTDGKWYEQYRSLLLRIEVNFDHGEVKVNAEVNEHLSNRFTHVWTALTPVQST
ncbi:MAG TPA: helix-turn-helix domain-containing protein [Candidatus Acidoferrales bacterium]|nr:helix-turn-helix domain-containing protein [Candidatus Acidoferrales bacterium]